MFAQIQDEEFLPVEGREKTARREHEWSLGQEGPPVVDPVQIPSSHVSHADRPRWTVQELVAVPAVDKHSVIQFVIGL